MGHLWGRYKEIQRKHTQKTESSELIWKFIWTTDLKAAVVRSEVIKTAVFLSFSLKAGKEEKERNQKNQKWREKNAKKRVTGGHTGTLRQRCWYRWEGEYQQCHWHKQSMYEITLLYLCSAYNFSRAMQLNPGFHSLSSSLNGIIRQNELLQCI